MVYRSLYSWTFFSYCFSMLNEFAKGFERKVWRVQVAHLHNAARAVSSPSWCFQLSTNLDKDFFRYLGYYGKKTNRIRFSVVLVKFHWFGINWRVFNQSEYRNCCCILLWLERLSMTLRQTANGKLCRPFSAVCTINWKYFHLRWIVGYIRLFLCGLFKDYKKRINNQR